jgi:hypothetical protein
MCLWHSENGGLVVLSITENREYRWEPYDSIAEVEYWNATHMIGIPSDVCKLSTDYYSFILEEMKRIQAKALTRKEILFK